MSDPETLADRLPPWTPSAVVALSAGVAGVLGSFGAVGYTPGFVVAPVESLLSSVMPGAVVTFAITVLGSLGQQLNLAFATGLTVLGFAGLAWFALSLGSQLRTRLVAAPATAVLVWVATVAVTLRPGAALWAAGAAGLVVGLSELSLSVGAYTGEPTTDGDGRRRVVSALGTAAAAGAVGTAVGRTQTAGDDDGTVDGSAGGDRRYDVTDQLETAMDRGFTVGDMDTVVSEDFFNVSINSVSPNVDRPAWSLSVTGTVEESFAFDFETLEAMDHEHRFITLRCVGEALNGHKMDTALWTGVPLAPIVERASPTGGCNCVMLRGHDGYEVQFPVEALETGMLAYGMNGEYLPRSHGAPVRALVPGHWGEVNTKWISEMEFLETEERGYWERRGWQGTGPVKTVAKLHGREKTDDGRVVVGGHAYAGTRGVSGVEVSTDGGDTWTAAELTDRLPPATGPAADRRRATRDGGVATGGGAGPGTRAGGGGGTADDDGTGGGPGVSYAADAWRAWRYAYDPPGGTHEVVVRAIERDGTVQSQESTGPVPDGAAGWVSDELDPSAL